MTKRATGSVEIGSWEETTWGDAATDGKAWNEVSGAKLTRAAITSRFHGDIEGEAVSQSLMMYPDDATARFIGFDRVVGSIGGRSGSFVIQAVGSYANGTAKGSWTVVPGSATGELTGLRGEGGYTAEHGQQQSPFTLDYHFEDAPEPEAA